MARLAPITKSDEWFTGKRRVFRFVVWQNIGTKTNPEWVRQDISGWSLKWVVVKTGASSEAKRIVEKVTADEDAGIEIVDGPEGECEVTVAAGDTDAEDHGSLWHELSRTDAGHEDVLSMGPAELQLSPT